MRKRAEISSAVTEHTTTYVWLCPECQTRNRSTRPSDDLYPSARCGKCHEAFALAQPRRSTPCR